MKVQASGTCAWELPRNLIYPAGYRRDPATSGQARHRDRRTGASTQLRCGRTTSNARSVVKRQVDRFEHTCQFPVLRDEIGERQHVEVHDRNAGRTAVQISRHRDDEHQGRRAGRCIPRATRTCHAGIAAGNGGGGWESRHAIRAQRRRRNTVMPIHLCQAKVAQFRGAKIEPRHEQAERKAAEDQERRKPMQCARGARAPGLHHEPCLTRF